MGGMLRRLRNDWLVTAVSVTGLSLAMAGCILIWSYIRFEFSYDDYHTHAADIYRIDTRTTADGLASESALCPLRYAPALVRDFPQVIAAVRIVRTVKRSFSVGEKHFMEDGVCYADASLWKVFSFRMLEGDTATALQLPFTMVITRSMAEKYFGREDPLGKAIRWDNRNDYTVTGVVEDPPPNSHFTFRALASFSTFFKYDPGLENLWLEWNVPTYMRLQEGTDPREFEQKLGDFSRKYLQEALQSRGITIEHSLRPLRRLHLYKGAAGALGEARDIRTLYSLVAVMFLVILIACFNIINLSLARSGARIPEVRIRKVLGAGKRDLVARFLGESLLLSLAALLLACLVSAAAAPWFRNMTALPVPRFGHISSLQLPFGFTGILPFLAGLVLLTGLLAGTGPAFVLASAGPAREAFQVPGRRRAYFRSLLMILQFAVSVFLLVFTLAVNSQQDFLRHSDPGFRRDRLVIQLQNQDVRDELATFRDELLAIDGIESVCASSMVPGEMYLFSTGTYPEGHSREQQFNMQNFRVDPYFFDSYGIDIVDGRPFDPDMPTDRDRAILINQTAATRLGWKDPTGRTIEMQPDITAARAPGDSLLKYTVIGVFRDFHYQDLYSPIQPAFVLPVSNRGPVENRARRLSVGFSVPPRTAHTANTGHDGQASKAGSSGKASKTGRGGQASKTVRGGQALKPAPQDRAKLVSEIEALRQKHFGELPFYSFMLDDFYASLHLAERRLGRIFTLFTLLAVCIACLGLFALSHYTTARRTREIAVRKVLGGTTRSVLRMLNREFLLLVLLANLLAWPAAILAVRAWLRNYPYTPEFAGGLPIPPLSAFLILAGSFLLGLAVVSFQSLRASRTNPADALRDE